MAMTRDRISDRGRTMKPYVERALKDEDLRDNVMAAYAASSRPSRMRSHE